MSKIKNLHNLMALAILVLGLVRCGTDKNSNKTAAPTAWRIAEPTILRAGQGDISFTMAEGKFNALELSDIIKFSSASDVTLKLETTCFFNDEPAITHKFSEKLRDQYYFFELLPPQILLTSHTSNSLAPKCRFDFVAINSHGDSHRFRTKLMPIQMKSPKALVDIYYLKAPVENNSSDLLTIKIDELDKYSLPQLKNINSQYHIRCKGLFATIKNTSGQNRLSEFEFKIATENKSESPMFGDDMQICRALEMMGDHVLAMSERFILQKSEIRLSIKNLKSPDLYALHSTNAPLLMAHFRVSNPYGKNLKVSISDKQMPQGQVVITLTGRGPKIVGQSVSTPLHVQVIGAAVSRINDQQIFTLKPAQIAEIRIYSQLKTVNCPGYSIAGFLYGLLPHQYPLAEIVDKLETNDDTEFVTSTLQLGDDVQKYVPLSPTGSSSGFGVPTPKPITQPVISELKEGLCSVTVL